MKILSLFDGMACGYEALLRAGIKIDKYYASEIDKYAIQIALKNHPDIIEIGDVCNVKGEDYQDIDLLIGGSPCQGFSVAGKRLNFEDPRSKLFFEYVRILKECQPRYFLLENVIMKKEWQDIISSALGVQPICINSSLVSAQNRKRLYRTNIPSVSMPKDKGIILKDILEDNVDEKYYYSEERWNRILNGKYDIVKRLEDANKKCNTLTTVGGGNHEKKIAEDLVFTRGGEVLVRQATKQGFIVANDGDGISLAYPNSTTRRGRVIKGKSATLTTQGDSGVYEPKMAYNPHTRDYQVNGWKGGKSFTLSAMDYAHPKVVMIPQMVRVRKYEVDTEGLKEELRSHKSFSNKEIAERLGVPKTTVDHWFRIDSCFAIPDENIWLKLKDLLGITTDRFDKSITEFEERQGTYEKAERKIPVEGKMTTLTTSQNDEIINGVRIRKLTPIECERLQTLPDRYTEGVSDSQRYKMLGNGWTVDVIAHIFSFIK